MSGAQPVRVAMIVHDGSLFVAERADGLRAIAAALAAAFGAGYTPAEVRGGAVYINPFPHDLPRAARNILRAYGIKERVRRLPAVYVHRSRS